MRGMPLDPVGTIGTDSYILAVILFIFVILGLNAPHMARIFRNFFTDVWSNRQRDNIFEEHVATESQTMLLLLMQTSVVEGVLLFCFFRENIDMVPVAAAAICTALATAFNIFSAIACRITGWTFTDQSLALQWRRGLFSTQAMLGLFLLPPAIVALTRPEFTEGAVIIGVLFYLVARILYIAKGLRIFYENIGSLIYFILYLCTLEITPLIAVWRIAAELISNR